MKKVLFVMAMAMVSVVANAQFKKGDMFVAPKVGLNIANLTSTDNTKSKLGLAVGVEGLYMLTDNIGLSAALLYSDQGTSIDVPRGDDDINLGYINVPVLANFYVADGLALKVGLQPGLLISAKEDQSVDNYSATEDVKDNMESLDLSIPIGISYEFNNFIIDGRYNLGFTKVPKGSDTKESKNSVIQLTVGYRFNL